MYSFKARVQSMGLKIARWGGRAMTSKPYSLGTRAVPKFINFFHPAWWQWQLLRWYQWRWWGPSKPWLVMDSCQRWCSSWCQWRSSLALLFAFSPPTALLPRRSRNVYCSSLFGGFQWRRIFHNIFNNNDIYHVQQIWYYPTSHLLLPIVELSQFKRQGKVPCQILPIYKGSFRLD